MKAAALLILLLFPSLALAQQQYYGSIASSVNLSGPADPMDTVVLAILPGETITADNIRSSIQALYKTGHYRTIAADAVTGPAGTELTFIVTAQYYFSTFRLEPASLLDRPITSYFATPYGKKFSSGPAERLAAEAVERIEEAGYFGTGITPEYSFNESKRLVSVVLKARTIPERAKIESIEILGAQNIVSDKNLHKALGISKGDEFSADKTEKGRSQIRKKFVDLGYLTAKVQVERSYNASVNAVDLKIQIDPGQTTIVRVNEAGTTKSEVSENKLRTLVPIFEEGAVDSDLVAEGQQNIVNYYHQLGYFDATATSEVTPGPDQSVHVVYTVQKGERHRVRSVLIEDNAFFSEADILARMKTSEGKSSGHGLFSDELLAADVREIQSMYQKAGFRSTTVDSSYEQSAEHDIDVKIQIHEGLRSTLDNITFAGNNSFPEPDLWKVAGIQSDEVYSAAIIDNARNALAAFYLNKGFAEVRIESHLEFDPAYNSVDVRFDITEGPKYRIGWVLVSGNTHTAEKVITRTSGLKSDDPYNPRAILDAQQKLYSLGVFDRVEIVPIDQDLGDYKNLLIQVEEAKSILLTPGFGASDRYGPRATVELSDINLFGLARTVSGRVRASQNQRQFQTSYRDPHLLNHDLQGIISLLFDRSKNLDGNGDLLYRSNAIDVSLQVARKLSAARTLSFLASIETVYFRDISQNPNYNQFINVIDVNGSVRIGRLGASFIGDRRDNVVDPRHGTFFTADFEVADRHLASQVNFTSLFTQGSYYKSVRGGVIATAARIGWKQPFGGDKELPISEQFFAGGSTTLRGFKFDAAGPPFGGQLLTIANIEYRAPLRFLPIRNFSGGLFYDTGNVFQRASDFRPSQFTHTGGTGLRYMTPIGPIRVDVGFNLRPESTDRKYVVSFTLGHAF